MLPEPVMSFLASSAAAARTEIPDRDESLFRAGVLDSFSLVEFVVVLESACGISVRDEDLRPENFECVARIEEFVRRAAS